VKYLNLEVYVEYAAECPSWGPLFYRGRTLGFIGLALGRVSLVFQWEVRR
jgi:hypothetical protein